MGKYGNVKRGKAVDLSDGNYYLSGWERDAARFLNLLVEWNVLEGWEYEPCAFSFQGLGYKRGPFTYVPDFVVKVREDVDPEVQEVVSSIFPIIPGEVAYVEVKGQETGKDRSKWRRWHKHVQQPLYVIDRFKMKILQEAFSKYIRHWESRVR